MEKLSSIGKVKKVSKNDWNVNCLAKLLWGIVELEIIAVLQRPHEGRAARNRCKCAEIFKRCIAFSPTLRLVMLKNYLFDHGSYKLSYH